jgi:hypothetical protein
MNAGGRALPKIFFRSDFGHFWPVKSGIIRGGSKKSQTRS